MPARLTHAAFEARVVPLPTGCWEYAGPRTPTGYGTFGRRHYAHRYAYERAKGVIPSDKEIDHVCRNRACVNPDHLEVVAHVENCRRVPQEIKLVCARGHLLTDDNVLAYHHHGLLERVCRACKNLTAARYRAKRRAIY